jgi:hypothetical protein
MTPRDRECRTAFCVRNTHVATVAAGTRIDLCTECRIFESKRDAELLAYRSAFVDAGLTPPAFADGGAR